MCVCVCFILFIWGGERVNNTDRQTGRKVLSNYVYLALSTVHMRTWNTPQSGNKKNCHTGTCEIPGYANLC